MSSQVGAEGSPSPGSSPASSQTNKYDVEIENARLSWSFKHRLADGFVVLMSIGSMGIPIWLLGVYVVEPLAGRTTNANINVNVALSITIAASLAVNGFQYVKGGERKRTIEQQRDRMDDYEQRLGLPPTRERRRLGRRTL